MPTLRDLQGVLVCSFSSNETRVERKVAFAVSIEVSQPSVAIISQESQQEKESSEFVHNDKWGRSSNPYITCDCYIQPREAMQGWHVAQFLECLQVGSPSNAQTGHIVTTCNPSTQGLEKISIWPL